MDISLKSDLDSLIGLPASGMRLIAQCMPAPLRNIPALLEGTHFSTEDWAGGQAMVTWKQLHRFLNNTLALNPPADLPLRAGLQAGPNVHGAMGMAAMTSQCVDDALRMFEQYMATRSQIFEMSYVRAGSPYSAPYCSLVFNFLPPDDRELRFLIVAVLSSAFCNVKFLAGGTLQGAEIHFKWSRPENAEDYEHAFEGNTVVFDASAFAIRIPLRTTTKSIISSDKVLNAVAIQHCESQVQSMRPKGSTAQWVLSQISLQQGHLLTLEQLADDLKISSRTLLRRLKQEGVSFQELLDHDCSRRASALLKSGVSVAAVAEQLGYSEPVSFRRAFKRWFGIAPSEFRERN